MVDKFPHHLEYHYLAVRPQEVKWCEEQFGDNFRAVDCKISMGLWGEYSGLRLEFKYLADKDWYIVYNQLSK
jgi:hypothetical protein